MIQKSLTNKKGSGVAAGYLQLLSVVQHYLQEEEGQGKIFLLLSQPRHIYIAKCFDA